MRFSLTGIPGNGDQIHINSNSPIGSKWTFKCTMKSILVNTKKILNKTISFDIAKNSMENCGEKYLTSKISDIEESVEENGRLHEDIKLVLDQVKEQMGLMGEKQQETSRRLNGIIEQGKEQMKLMREKQQETSKRLNSSIEQVLLNIALNVINKLTMKGFNHICKLSLRNKCQSPPFPSISPLSIMLDLNAIKYWIYSLKLRFTNPKRIQANIDMKYKCEIIQLEPRYKRRYATYDINYRGISDMDSASVRNMYYTYPVSISFKITCNLFSYKYLP